MREIRLDVTDMERRFGAIEKRRDSCEVHGDFASVHMERKDQATGQMVQRWTECPDCARDRQSKVEQEEQHRERERRMSERVASLLGRAAIPSRFAGKSLDDYRAETEPQQRVLAACREYAETFPERLEDGRCLVMLGPPGTGKTHLAAAIACEVIRRHRLSAVYSTVSEAVRRIKDNWTTREMAESAIIETFAGPSLLVLDEIGMGWGSDTELLYLFEIVNARYQAKKPTIIAGNIERENVRSCLGDRVADRLNEAGCRTLLLNWKSARGSL